MTKVLYYKGSWLLDQIFVNNKFEFNEKILNFICANQTGWFTNIFSGYDRTVDVNHYPIRLDCLSLPSNPLTISLSEVFVNRAQEIWALNKRISFFWSGGIDSTAALIALMMTNEYWYENIDVYTTNYSIETEHPLFYNTYLKERNCVKLIEGSELLNSNLYTDKELVVTGDCADQLFGFGMGIKPATRMPGDPLITKSIRHTSYEELRETLFDKVKIKLDYLNSQDKFRLTLMSINKFHELSEAKTIYMNWMDSYISRSPIPIETGFDFHWWVAFSMKYQALRYRIATITANASLTDTTKYMGFFDHPDFQRWSMDNHSLKWPSENVTDYKKPFKDFIFEYTNDNDYQLNKTKVISMQKSLEGTTLRPESLIRYVDSTGYMITHEQRPTSKLLSEEKLNEILLGA